MLDTEIVKARKQELDTRRKAAEDVLKLAVSDYKKDVLNLRAQCEHTERVGSEDCWKCLACGYSVDRIRA